MSFYKGIYVGNLQWDSTKKILTAWDNIFGAEVLGMGDKTYVRVRKLCDT